METPPLQSPVKQQAHDKLRGYGYQCWLTVEAWLRLEPQECLYAECAEDFATFGQSGDANIGQAKDAQAKLTLRSDDAAEALNHFWAFRVKHKSGELRYSFITTGGVTTEQNNPFDGKPGITLWQEVVASKDLAEVEKLRKYLTEDKLLGKKLAADMVAYLRGATAADTLRELLLPFVWDTKHPDSAGIRASVESQLGYIVDTKFGATPTHRENLADSLFSKIYAVASEKEKTPVTAALLLNTIEKHLVPSVHAALAAQYHGAIGGLVVAGSPLATVASYTDVVSPIALPEGYSPRDSALKSLQAMAGQAPFLLIEGSSGMGKSTLADIYTNAEGGRWIHLRAPAKDPILCIRALKACTVLVTREASPFGLIIDDLAWDDFDGMALGVVHGMVRAARLKGARLIFTNQRAPNAVTRSAAGLSDLVQFSAPTMVAEEVTAMAPHFGSLDAGTSARWAPIVIGLTSGHPRLVHASLIGLRARGWPSPSFEELQTATATVKQLRSESQLLLRDRRTEEIELLTRLSAFFGTFRRDHAVAIGEQLERIVGTSGAFENLRGPWIEPISSTRFQLSPLLAHSLIGELPKARAQAVNRAVALVLIAGEPLEARDAINALLNAFLANAHDLVAPLVTNFLTTQRESSAALHAQLSWTLAVVTEGPSIFAEAPIVDCMFRILQFEVAASISPEKCETFIEACERQLKLIADSDGIRVINTMLAFTFVKTNQTPIPFRRLFWALEKMEDTVTATVADGTFTPKAMLPAGVKAQTPQEETRVFVVLEIWTRASRLDSLRSLLDCLLAADEPTRSRYLALLTLTKGPAILAFDLVWLAEDKRAERNWTPLLMLFHEFLAAAEKWDCGLLAACAARSISVIEDEYLSNPGEAAKALDRVTSDDPEVRAIVTERWAKSAQLGKRYAEAQQLFEAAIEHSPWSDFTASGTVTLYQNAGAAAGNAGNWEASAAHFMKGSELAKQDGDWTSVFAFLADAAYATWQFGDKSLAVDRLYLAFDLLPRLPPPEGSLRSRRTSRLFGHLVTNLAWKGSGRNVNANPSPVTPGMCSEARDDKSGVEMTSPNVTLQEAVLLSLVFQHSTHLTRLEPRVAALEKSDNPMIRYFIGEIRLRMLLKARDFRKLAAAAIADAHSLQLCKQLQPDGGYAKTESAATKDGITLHEPLPIPMVLMTGITIGALAGMDPRVVVGEIRSGLGATPVENETAIFLATIDGALAKGVEEAAGEALASSDQSLRWAYSLRLLTGPHVFPDGLLLANIFFTFSHLAHLGVGRFAWLADMVPLLDQGISAKWRLACDARSAFKDPTLWVPDIKALAASPAGTINHLAKLVMAARPALRVNIASDLAAAIKALAEAKA